MPNKINLIGKRFGRLFVIREIGSKKVSTKPKVWWLCQCDCGKVVKINSQNLRNGHAKSCGCLWKDTMKKIHYKHGGKGTKLYMMWINMISRCYNLNNKYYAARGIKVCREWRNSYIVFREWALKNGYKDNLTIDRIDGNGNYEPSNCQFITKSENSNKANDDRYKNYQYKINFTHWRDSNGRLI